MAITTKTEGVWGLDQVYKKSNQDIWKYSSYPRQMMAWGRRWPVGNSLGTNPNPAGDVSLSSPVQVGSALPGGDIWKAIVKNNINGGEGFALATKTDGTLWSWGVNSDYQLGLSNKSPKTFPNQIGTKTNWGGNQQIASATYGSYVINTSGELYSWGYNGAGYLGHNNKSQYQTPTIIGTGQDWSQVRTTNAAVIALKTDGTLFTWGIGSHGMLGIGDDNAYSSPKQIPGTTWGPNVCFGGQFGLAMKTDGSLWTWGSNEYGQLGQNQAGNPYKTSSPIQLPGTTWAKIGANDTAGYGIKTDGTLWAWGQNEGGCLGQNEKSATRDGYSSPVQIGTETNWREVDGLASESVMATKTDGTLWTWGRNGYGVLGQNEQGNTASYSSPVQIPGTWGNMGQSNYMGFAIKPI